MEDRIERVENRRSFLVTAAAAPLAVGALGAPASVALAGETATDEGLMFRFNSSDQSPGAAETFNGWLLSITHADGRPRMVGFFIDPGGKQIAENSLRIYTEVEAGIGQIVMAKIVPAIVLAPAECVFDVS